MSIRILIADDQALVRTGFKMILDAEADLLGARADLTRAQLGEVDARAGLALAAGQLTPAWIEENLEKRS